MHFMDALDELGKPTIVKFDWMNSVEFILGTVDLLEQVERECLAAKRIGLDTETTGLDQRAFPTDSGRLVTQDKIVGYCIAPSTTKGYYFPVRHRGDGAEANVPPRLVIAMLQRLHEAGVVFVFHNAKFDQKFLQYDPAGEAGDWDAIKSWDDTILLAYLRDARQRERGLKFLSKTELGREMIELKDLFPIDERKGNLNFSVLDPRWEPTVWYACSDAVNTLALYDRLAPAVLQKDKFNQDMSTVYQIEKLCLRATVWMEQCRIFIDRPTLIELIKKGQKEWWDCLNEVYFEVSKMLGRNVSPPWVSAMAPYDYTVLSPDYMAVRSYAKANAKADDRPPIRKSVPNLIDRKVMETIEFSASYDIMIPAEFGKMLRELGVEGLVATEKSGQVKTSKDVLDRVIEEAGDTHPWMRAVKKFREVTKSLGSMLFNVYYATAPERSPDGCVWVSFKGMGTDTGRFATPTPKEDREWFGQASWNVHSTKAAAYDPKNPPPECVYRQREIVAARPGYILFAIDFSGVELRIVTNISGEPKWLAEFFRCATCTLEFDRTTPPPPFCPKCGSDKIGDLHSLTAIGIYGEKIKEDPKLFKVKRQIGKIVNFLLCYGGSGNAVMRSTKVDKEEGWRIKNQFDKTYVGLLKWWKSQEKLAQHQLYVTTCYGRKCFLPDIVSSDNFFRSKANRNAVNSPVQGSSADIMKLAMGLLYKEFKKRGWIFRGSGLPDLVLMTITIHDELVFEIHDSLVAEAVPVIEKIMCEDTVRALRWIVPLKVDVEFGPNWLVSSNLTAMTWNKGGGSWDERLVSAFPDRYANYLKLGGTPIDADSSEPQPSQMAAAYPLEKDERPDLESEGDDAAVEEEGEEAQGQGTEEPPPVPVREELPTLPVRKEEDEGGAVMEKEGATYVYRIPRKRMTPENAKKLAIVVTRCFNRGVDLLKVTDMDGNDLLGGTVKVAYQEFQVIARYEGLG